MLGKNRFKIAVWSTCLLAGASALYAQWLLTPEQEAPQSPVMAAAPARVEVEPLPALTAPAKPQSARVAPAIDTRLVARLLVDSVTQVESAGNPRLVGSHGERGLMQIKSGAWGDVTHRLYGRRISFDRAFESKLNQQVGAAYLADLQRFLGRHQRVWKADERSLLLACYNAGPERVKRAGFDLRRLPAHTQDYVKRASSLHDALLADHQVDPARIRLAMSQQKVSASGT